MTQTLVEGNCPPGLAVAAIKHDGHDFIPDVPGTDSYRHKAAGAYGTVVYSEKRFCLERGNRASGSRFFGYFNDADLILLEGMKDSGLS